MRKNYLQASIALICLLEIWMPVAAREQAHGGMKEVNGQVIEGDWLDEPQIYTHLAVPLDTAAEMGVTVNGLWNGWGMKSPVASMNPGLIFWRFKSDSEYVEDLHEAGFLHGACLSNAYAHPAQIEADPRLADAICRTITNEKFVMDGGWYLGEQPFMCRNSPAWQDALLARAKKMIDAGTDSIVFDEPFGDTFFASLPLPGFPGYSDLDLSILASDLKAHNNPKQLEERFALDRIDPETLRNRLARMDIASIFMSVHNQGEEGSDLQLWRHFHELQLSRNYEIKKKLVQAIRDYAKKTRGTSIPIGANLAELDSYALLNRQLPVLYLADLFDFLAFEMAYRPHPEERGQNEGRDAFVLGKLGKWLPWYQLGEALVGPHRALAYPSQEMVDAWMGKEEKINYLCHLVAEAYAA